MSDSKARHEEERHKELIYESFESDMRSAANDVRNASDYFESGRYEDQDAFLAAAPVASARDVLHSIRQRNNALYRNTYFAHVEVLEDGSTTTEHYFLSNSEGLDELLWIDREDADCAIIPFIQDRERPFLGAVFECYRLRSGEDFEITTLDRHTQANEHFKYHPQLIRDVEVKQRKIIGEVTTFFSTSADDDSSADYDELFAQRLEENRSTPGLHNIIATLQKQQFEIINQDKDRSFVVQGCAGSGKSQCLIHRLFYLRSILQEDGWDKVLLVTPTQVFRNYSSELMKRYRLDGIANTSIADFYRTLLNAFDPRFRNRQYVFELSEEYLPDKYLHEVYAPANMMRIDRAIREAIYSHVESACRLLELDEPIQDDIDIDYINALVAKLAERIVRFDEIEHQMADDPEFLQHRKAIDDLDKELKALHRRQANLLDRQTQLRQEYERFEELRATLASAETDVQDWLSQIEEKKHISRVSLDRCINDLNHSKLSASMLTLLAQYVELRKAAIDVTAPWGTQAQFDEGFLELLQNHCEECRQALSSFTKKATPAIWLKNHDKSINANEENLSAVQDDITIAELYLEDHSAWLQEHNIEEAQQQRQTYRAELERARYYLSRIESSVFEQEVWNELAGSKKENGIETLQIIDGKDGHQRQNRILYKSDLLFYLKIYHSLHKRRSLPDYRMICIDEGQDLHSADYELLRELYPDVVMNIFGDVAQALHVECGISNWQAETGINTVFTLNSNYRNNAAIVDFCNRKFGSSMDFCGSVANYQEPRIVGTITFKRMLAANSSVLIVKNREKYIEMCESMNIDPDSMCYVDTKVDSVDIGRITCYSIFAAKGLEFQNVMVYADGMTDNQKIVACTRAMKELVYCE